MRIFRDYMKKTPTEYEYRVFLGGNNHNLWSSLPENWRCPVCNRNKQEIMRWVVSPDKRTIDSLDIFSIPGEGEKRQFDRKTKGKWVSPLHRHHDHGDRWKGEYIICGDCNSADGIAKRLLHLPFEWSFSVDELKEFVECELNGSLKSIDLDLALDIYIEEKMEEGLF